ncbi:MAG: hypothetical protein N2V75_09545 [Methanophagales archaeon]|nr:hypothetical protein [Methanophagales archaeon]
MASKVIEILEDECLRRRMGMEAVVQPNSVFYREEENEYEG